MSAVFTIGHSIHDTSAFLERLRVHETGQIADIRAFPYSRRQPHFGREALEACLRTHGIGYRHFAALGGRRRPAADSVNTAWREAGFRGYADYMGTPDFHAAVGELLRYCAEAPTAVMCAESLWWKCHRRLLADALVVAGAEVLHILSTAPARPHALSEFARVQGGALTYPGLL